MSHIPFGYKIENGKAVTDAIQAVQIRILVDEYLNGKSLAESARVAGINKNHSAVSLLLSNQRYLGDNFYPAIIDKTTWGRVALERERRAIALGRNKSIKSIVTVEPSVFFLKESPIINIGNNFNKNEIHTLLLHRAQEIYNSIEKRSI